MDIPQYLLSGKYVHLQKLQTEHKDVLKKLAKDERIWEFTKTLLVNEKYDAMFDAYFAIALDNNAFESQQAFVVYDNTNNVIGMTRLYEINDHDKRLAIGYTWYIPQVWGNVHNKECKLLLLQYIFEQLKFNRVALYVAHQNVRSQKAVEKIGGVKEGVLRKHAYKPDGEIRHTVVYSIINDEWPTVKQNLITLINILKND
jgi:N-acetyltransferase